METLKTRGERRVDQAHGTQRTGHHHALDEGANTAQPKPAAVQQAPRRFSVRDVAMRQLRAAASLLSAAALLAACAEPRIKPS
ncbi:MAG: hypothetical protein N2690_12890, partial [Rhodocyclaceae bacterium]|nr:hypothetical protein [Rhodocyclaceae bacterium]